MDKFLKKRSHPSGDSSRPAKRPVRDPETAIVDQRLTAPRVIVAWNCNGLTSRLRNGDEPAIKLFVERHAPDVIFLSEVRIAAANDNPTAKPNPKTKWYRYRMRDGNKKALEELSLVNTFMRSKEMAKYRCYFSLADTKYAGTAMLLNTETTAPPISVRYNLEPVCIKGNVHDGDGRVIVAKFTGFSILHTYSPNNGWDENHLSRRRDWDQKIKEFVIRKKEAKVNLMWIGDLNVAPLDVDLSHPAYYKKQKGGRNTAKLGPSRAPPSEEDVGQPGCTPRERSQFREILKVGNMVDAYRELVGESDNSGLTWRGHTTGKHAGRGMRIDHCIVSRSVMPSIVSVQITGHGFDRIGFLGSDHCPLLISRQCSKQASEDK